MAQNRWAALTRAAAQQSGSTSPSDAAPGNAAPGSPLTRATSPLHRVFHQFPAPLVPGPALWADLQQQQPEPQTEQLQQLLQQVSPHLPLQTAYVQTYGYSDGQVPMLAPLHAQSFAHRFGPNSGLAGAGLVTPADSPGASNSNSINVHLDAGALAWTKDYKVASSTAQMSRGRNQYGLLIQASRHTAHPQAGMPCSPGSYAALNQVTAPASHESAAPRCSVEPKKQPPSHLSTLTSIALVVEPKQQTDGCDLIVDVIIPEAQNKSKSNRLRLHTTSTKNIADLKRLVKRNWGVPICQQRLALSPGGRALPDSCNIARFQAKSGDDTKGKKRVKREESRKKITTKKGGGGRETGSGAKIAQGAVSNISLFFTQLAPPTVIRRWSTREDRLLFEAIAKFGEKDWESVARHVGTRKGLRCRQRWMNTLKPGHVKGKWSKADDNKLLNFIEQQKLKSGNGNIKWSEVAAGIEGRNIKQVKERWCNYLNPHVRTDTFTAEEDAFLVEKKEAGMGWSAIAKLMKTRVANQLKNRYSAILRRRKREQRKAERAKLLGHMVNNGTSDEDSSTKSKPAKRKFRSNKNPKEVSSRGKSPAHSLPRQATKLKAK